MKCFTLFILLIVPVSYANAQQSIDVKSRMKKIRNHVNKVFIEKNLLQSYQKNSAYSSVSYQKKPKSFNKLIEKVSAEISAILRDNPDELLSPNVCSTRCYENATSEISKLLSLSANNNTKDCMQVCNTFYNEYSGYNGGYEYAQYSTPAAPISADCQGTHSGTRSRKSIIDASISSEINHKIKKVESVTNER